MEIPDDHFPDVYISAPTSPAGLCSPHNDLPFYSVPSSPTRETTTDTSPFGYETDLNECPTPMSYHDANSYLDDDFQFETCRSFSLNAGDHAVQSSFGIDRKPRQRGGSLPTTMAFADELFCDGKVMPLAPPLKLPPRLQMKRNEELTGQEGTGGSVPGSPSNLLLKLPFGYKRLWNDDFDPFMAALKNVKDEKEKAPAASPSYVGNNQSTSEPGDQHSTTNSAHETISKEIRRQIVPKRQLAEPRGVEFARQVRLIQLGQMSKSDKLGKQGERDEKAESMRKKPTFLRKLYFKSGRAAHCKDQEKRASHPHPHFQLSKMALMHYRPRGLPCLGYKAR